MVCLGRHGTWPSWGRRVPSAQATGGPATDHRNLPAQNCCDFFDLTAASRVVTRKSAKPTVGALTDLQSCAILLIGESQSWKPS